MHYTGAVAWVVVFTPRAEEWISSLSGSEWASMATVVDLLEQEGPTLGRPVVDTIKGSRHANMKELRSAGGHLRALFAFDPRRQAIVLLGGDKTGDWRGWYERNVPTADDLFDNYLAELRDDPEG